MQSNGFGIAEKYFSQFMQILIGFAYREEDDNNGNDDDDDNGIQKDEDNGDVNYQAGRIFWHRLQVQKSQLLLPKTFFLRQLKKSRENTAICIQNN